MFEPVCCSHQRAERAPGTVLVLLDVVYLCGCNNRVYVRIVRPGLPGLVLLALASDTLSFAKGFNEMVGFIKALK